MSFRVDGYQRDYKKGDMTKRMNHFYESKPDVKIEIPELNRNYMKFSAITFDSKKNLTAEHFLKNRDRYNYIMDDFSKLLKGTRVEGTNIDVATVDITKKDFGSDYRYSDIKYGNRGLIGFTQRQGEAEKGVGYSEVNNILVRADITRPRALVHELAHVVDTAKAKDGSLYRSVDELTNLQNGWTQNTEFGNIYRMHRAEAERYFREDVSKGTWAMADMSGYKEYICHPSEVHSRLFESFYARDIDAYRDYENKIDNIYSYENPDYNRFKGMNSMHGERIADKLYQNNDMVRDYMMTEYAEIIPDNHPEKAKYMELHNEKELMSNQEVKSLEPEGFADDDYEDVDDDLYEYKSASDNAVADGPSDAELLARFEQVEAEAIDAPEVRSRDHGDYGPSLY